MMMHARLFLSILAAALAMVPCSCSEEPTGPDKQVDSTSHAFVWYTDTLGGVLSTVNDVFCLSETDAWAVGRFYVRENGRTGPVVQTCNVARWDGEKWSLIRVNPLLNGQNTFTELEAVHGFASDDVWSNGRHYNGTSWVAYDLNGISQGTTRKIWGDNPDHVFFAGDNGNLTLWDGRRFKQIGFQTTAANKDIWGWKDTMYVAVSDYDQQSGRLGYLMRFENGKFVRNETPTFDVQIAVWGMDGTWYCGGCTDLFRNTGDGWKSVLKNPNCITGIRGTTLNNVYIFLTRGEIIHFNGKSFASIVEQEMTGNYYTKSISTSGTMVLGCGDNSGFAVVKRGYQQQLKE
jgi:hypothetical protein